MNDGMEALLDEVTTLVAQIHPGDVRRLVSLIRKKADAGVSKVSPDRLLTAVSEQRLTRLLDLWQTTGISADEFSGILIGASDAYHRVRAERSVELVWTGPSSELVATRKTEQVLLEVIGSAEKELFLTSFVAYKIDSIMEALKRAVDRGVEISILLESSEQHGGGISVDSISQMRESLPDARVYYWKRKEGEFADGRVHAKVVVADARICFISSANLTGYAMDRNMEAGVLIRGGEIPDRLHRHLDALVTVGVVSA